MPRGVKRSRDEKVQAMAMIELGYTSTQVSKALGIPTNTILGWMQEYKASNTKLPQHVLDEMQQELVEAARRQFQMLKNRYGNWALGLTEDIFEIAHLAAQRLKEELSKDTNKINSQLLYRLSGTLHYMIGDATLLAGMPTQRQAVVDETLESIASSAPPMELEEKASKLIDLAESMRRRAMKEREEREHEKAFDPSRYVNGGTGEQAVGAVFPDSSDSASAAYAG